MDEKVQYRNLLNNLNIIRSKFSRMNSYYNNMVSSQKESFTIDRKIIDEDKQQMVHRDINRVIDELNNVVIPMVKNKI